jgi:LPXTG-motif cell wall-anchored protein
MRDIVKEYQEKFRRNHQRARRYTALLLALALTTSLFVNWQLHGVGIAKTAEYLCGELEHEHTAACYEKQLVCGYEEGEPEDWNATMTDDGMSFDDTFGMDDAAFGVDADDSGIAAYSAEPEYIFVPHEHTDDCYQEVQELTCLEEEHTHTDDCFDPEDGSLICDLFEHTHDDSCYTTTYELVCGLEEGELVEEVNPDYDPVALFEEPVAAKPVVVDPVIETPVHHHTDACYEEVLVCGLPEHHHTVNCLSDPMDDTQDEDEWLDKTGTALTGMWNEDLLTVAQGQLGYEQSEKNFKLDTDDGETLRYYTRYGQWYGNPYGEWDVMFLSYCLNYANIPQSAIPQRASTLALRSELRSTGYLLDPDSDIAAYEMDADMSVTGLQPGDIVFYNATTTETVAVADEPQIEDLSPDADTELLQALSAPAAAEPQTEERTVSCETVGIVSAVDEASGTLTVISGNVDGKVSEVSLAPSQLTGMIPVASVQAAESGADTMDGTDLDFSKMLNGSQYVTDFKIQKLQDSDYSDVTESTVTDKLHGFIDLHDIPADRIKDNHYKVYVPIPEGLDKLNNGGAEKGSLKDSSYSGLNGTICGTYEFVQDADGDWYVVFTYDKDYINQQETTKDSKVKTDVSFDFQWDTAKISTDESNKFTINGKDITITIKDQSEDKPSDKKNYSLSKDAGSLRYDSHDAYIDYTVTLKLKDDMAAPLTLTDALRCPTNADFQYTGTPDVSGSNGASNTTVSWTDGTDSSTKTITLGQEGETLAAGTYTITYQVKATNFGNVDYVNNEKVKNTVTFRDTSKTKETSLTTKLIDKSGKLENGEIIWTVKINIDQDDTSLRYLPNDAKFTDTLPDDPIDNKITVTKDGESTDVTLDNTIYDNSSKLLTYPLDEGFHSYEITYRTKAPENASESEAVVKNTGKIDGTGINGSDSFNVKIPSTLLSKHLENGSHDTQTATMDWVTTVNATDLNTLVYYDWSSTRWDADTSKSVRLQQIVADSVHVFDASNFDVTDKVTINYQYSRTENGAEVGLFSVDFKEKNIQGPATIKYQTTADLSWVASGTHCQITNYGQLNQGDIVSDVYDFTNSSEQRKYFRKSAGDSSNWNKTEDTITLKPGQKIPWTIAINDTTDEGLVWDAKKDKEWVVKDLIPAGLNLDESSVRVELNGNTVSSSYYTVSAKKQADGSTKLVVTLQPECYTLTVNGNKTLSKRVFITYDTTLDPDNTEVWNGGNVASFVNNATFERNGEQSGSDSFKETVTRNVVGKHGNYDEATGLLTYQVQVNPNSVTLNNGVSLTLYDFMSVPDGLYSKDGTTSDRVTLAGVSVFEGELQADGSLEATTFLKDLAPIEGDYDSSSAPNNVTENTYYTKRNKDRNQIQVWTKVPDGKALVLVFHYTVNTKNLPAKNYKFKNTVQLEGYNSYVDENVDFTSDSSGNAGIDFNTNNVTIVKYSGTQSNLLSDAKFQLEAYDNGQWTDVKQYVTSQSGNSVMSGLTQDTLYRLHETAAPEGYLLPDPTPYHYFVISKNAYTLPTDSGFVEGRDSFALYKLGENESFGSFYYYCNNARNPDYVKEGDLLVKKAWKNFDGTDITDTSKLPEIVVMLTKHVANPGHRILLQLDDGSGTKVFAKNINDGGDVYVTVWSQNYKNWLDAGVAITATGESTPDGKQIYKISNIISDITIKSTKVYYNGGDFYTTAGGTPITGTTDTEVGKVTLNSRNGWSARFENLEIDDGITYTIKEMSVEGYTVSYTLNNEALEAGASFALGKNTGSNGNGDTIVITNTAEESGGYVLPSTGGAGTKLYTAGGGALMLAALVCGVCRKRRRERRER